MARVLAVNVLVLDEPGPPVLLTAGKPVPAKYADQVGDHCFADDADNDEKPSRTRAAAK